MAGRSLLYDALAQNDVDMANHRLLNLDTSNLPPVGIPPTIHPVQNQWLHDWDAATQEWTTTRPTFLDLGGFLTGPQMNHIDQVGRIRVGIWQGTALTPPFVPTLDQIRSPLANVSINGFKLTNVAPPVDPNDAVNLAYMDFLLQGLQPKEAVRCATTVHITPATLTRPVDGVDLVEGDRVLVKNQNTPNTNGIYIASTGAWARTTDADSATELERAYCAVREGDVNSGTSWVQIHELTEPLSGDDDILFVLFSSTPTSNILAGAGLERVINTLNVLGTADRILVGATVDIDPGYIGQASITTLGVISTGTWQGDVLNSEFGGTGVNNNGQTITLSNASLQVQKIGLAVPDSTLVFQVAGGGNIVVVPTAGTLSTLAGAETLTNKRITSRTGTIASNAKPSINVDNVDGFYITALAEAITSMTDNLTGTPTDCQELVMWIKDNGVARAIAWNSASDKWAASPDLPLPVLTTAGKWLFLRFVYNIAISRWVLTTKLNNIAP